MSVEPGTFAVAGRVAYYRAEAERVQALALATPHGEGREYFQEVAREYRLLAAWYDADEPEAPAEAALGPPISAAA